MNCFDSRMFSELYFKTKENQKNIFLLNFISEIFFHSSFCYSVAKRKKPPKFEFVIFWAYFFCLLSSLYTDQSLIFKMKKNLFILMWWGIQIIINSIQSINWFPYCNNVTMNFEWIWIKLIIDLIINFFQKKTLYFRFPLSLFKSNQMIFEKKLRFYRLKVY